MDKFYLKHNTTGHIGKFVKSYTPTGMTETTQIKLPDGRIFYAPSLEFVALEPREAFGLNSENKPKTE